MADEAGVSRQRLGVWYARWQKEGEAGLEDRSSRPLRSPNLLPDELGDLIEKMRRETKRGPGRISGDLAMLGHTVSPATVHRELVRRGINRLRDLDFPTGEDMRTKVIRYEHGAPGDMLHIDVKKVGKIPQGGGWRAHGRESDQALKSRRKANKRPGYTYLHVCVDDNSRIGYVECHDNEKAVTAVAFFWRAKAFYKTHGIDIIKSVLTDNGSCYIAGLWKVAMRTAGANHRRTRRQTPRTNGKVERFNLTMKNEWLYVRPYAAEEDRRIALIPFLNEYNFDRPHSSIGNKPPMSRAPKPGPRLEVGVPTEVQIVTDEEGQLDLEF